MLTKSILIFSIFEILSHFLSCAKTIRCAPINRYFRVYKWKLTPSSQRTILCLTLTSISAVFRSTQLGQIGNCSRIHSLPVRVVECFVLSFLSCTKSLTTFHYYSDGHVAGLQRIAKSSHRYSHMSSPSQIRTGNPWKTGPIANSTN